MKPIKRFEYPERLQPVFKKARKLEWLTIAYLLSTALAMYLTMGNSQAMKTAWFEDLLSLTPSVSFLIASRIFMKKPNRDFPYGYHRVVSIAYLCSAVALFAVGIFLVIASATTLLNTEHPTIGLIVVFGHEVWLGYLMMLALLWGTIPAIFLGRKKMPLARQLHEKNLYTDAKMNKADWMTGLAAILGITGIGLGFWWADAGAALLISLDIIHDGFTNLKQAVFDLMNEIPKKVSNQKTDPVIDQIQSILAQKTWVKDSAVRLREEGHIYLGEGFVIVHPESHDLTKQLEALAEEIEKLDWRIQEFVLMPVIKLPEGPKD